MAPFTRLSRQPDLCMFVCVELPYHRETSTATRCYKIYHTVVFNLVDNFSMRHFLFFPSSILKMTQLSNGLIPFGPDANCTLDLCPLEASILRYQPLIAANLTCLIIFGLSLVVHTFQGFWKHTWGFTTSSIAGCILEIVGYVGRLMIHDNPFEFTGFLIQISMLL